MKVISKRLCTVLLCLLLMCAAVAVFSDDGRSYIDNPRGSFYLTNPYNGWGDLGADFHNNSRPYGSMPAEAFKGIHGRLQHFEVPGETNYSCWPIDLFVDYDANEMSLGYPSLGATCTYNGQHWPVYHQAYASGWGKMQAVNLEDDRFIKFFINNYCRATMMQPYDAQSPGQPVQNWFVGLDEVNYQMELYGIIDGNGTFTNCSTLGISVWDQPYVQSNTDYADAAVYCLAQIKAKAPDVRVVGNVGSIGVSAREADYFQDMYGNIFEDFISDAANWGTYSRWKFYDTTWNHATNAGNSTKAQIYHLSNVPAGTTGDNLLRDAYCAMMSMCSKNNFFGPYYLDDQTYQTTEVDPSRWGQIRSNVGKIVGSPVIVDVSGGYLCDFALSRQTDGGYVFFNDTGANYTWTLPGGTWYNSSDTQITQITCARGTGAYVKSYTGNRCPMPTINPRRSGVTQTGPLPITLSVSPFMTGCTIRYTTDGSDPTSSSTVYSSPFNINSSCTVKAKAFKAGYVDSFTSSADYTVTGTAPTVQFHLSSDYNNQMLDYYPLVTLSNPTGQTASVNYSVTGGTATSGTDYAALSGTLTFAPGEIYRHFQIDSLNNSGMATDKTVVITLSNPSNCSIGANNAFTYTITKNTLNPNLVPNPGLETAGGWTILSQGAIVASNAHTGSYSLRIAAGQPTQDSWADIESGASPNTSYTVSAWGKLDSTGTGKSGVVKVYFYKADGTYISGSSTINYSSGSYTKGSLTFTTPALTGKMKVSVLNTSTSGTPYFYTDDFLLVNNSTTSTIQPSAGSNGSISPSIDQPVFHGGSVQFTATPNSGYVVDVWQVDGGTVQTGGNTCTLANITANHTLNVTFKSQTYTIHPTAGSHGSISPSTDQQVSSGGSKQFTATPSTNYEVGVWQVDGNTVQTGGTTYTITNVTADHTVNVTFTATNLVPNPGLEATGSWTILTHGARVASNPHSGSYSLRISAGAPTEDSWADIITGAYPNTSYTVSAWGKLDSTGTGKSGAVKVYCYKSDGSFISGTSTVNFTGGSYTQGSLTFTTPALTAKMKVSVLNTSTSGTPNFYTDDFSLTQN